MNGWDYDIPEEKVKKDLKTNFHDFMNATSFVLPSGGVKGIYIIGAIQYLYEEFGIKHINSYYGTSIGAIISALLIIGYTPLEILVYICIKKIVASLLSSFNWTNILTKKKFLEPIVFIELLKNMINHKLGYIPTMGELMNKFGKKLCIVTISREDPSVPLYISSETHPHLSLVQALHMTSSIPFVFGYALYNEIEYFDGALLDEFPILYASKQDSQVFGIDLYRVYKKSDVVFMDMINMINIPMNGITKLLKNQLTSGSFIEIKTEDEYVTKNNVHLMEMFISGYRQCKELLPKEFEKLKQE